MMLALLMALATMPQPALPLDGWRADRAVCIEDAYKWIYQATQGGEHAAPTPADAAAWLEREWTTLDEPGRDEPLIEPLGDSGLVRLNLRPFRARGGSREMLLDAFLASAAAVRPDRGRFSALWRALGEELRRGPVGNLTRAEWERLDGTTSVRGYPAIDHSETYRRLRRPAYRLLTAEKAGELARPEPRRPR